jgi:hypothetical protein
MFYNINFSLFVFHLLNILLEFISPSLWQWSYFCCPPNGFNIVYIVPSNIKANNIFHCEKIRIANLVTHFKNNNEEYLKIKQVAEDKVKDILTNSKLLLKLATFSVIESLRSNPEEYNFVMYNIPNNPTSYASNYPSLMLSGRQQHQQQSFNDSYIAFILEEAEKLYNKISTELTNGVLEAATRSIMESS